MPKNMLFSDNPLNRRVRVLAATVQAGTPLLAPDDQRPAVAYTNSGDAVKTITQADIPMGGGVTTLTYPNPGVSLIGKETTLSYDGTWEHAVAGVTLSTAQGTLVYITAAGALNLTLTGNTLYGKVDYPTEFYKRAGIAPVMIGK